MSWHKTVTDVLGHHIWTCDLFVPKGSDAVRDLGKRAGVRGLSSVAVGRRRGR